MLQLYFILKIAGKSISEAWGHIDLKTQGEECPSTRERERESWLWFFYLYVYLSLGLPYVNWASQECCFFYLRSSLRSSDLLLFHFHKLFPSLSVATTILDSSSLFYLPNIPPSRDGRPNYLGIGASRSFWLLPAELGQRGILGLPLLLVSSLRVLIAVSI